MSGDGWPHSVNDGGRLSGLYHYVITGLDSGRCERGEDLAGQMARNAVDRDHAGVAGQRDPNEHRR